MGLILDTSIVIANERRGDSVRHILRQHFRLVPGLKTVTF